MELLKGQGVDATAYSDVEAAAEHLRELGAEYVLLDAPSLRRACACTVREFVCRFNKTRVVLLRPETLSPGERLLLPLEVSALPAASIRGWLAQDTRTMAATGQ
jgi:hypothetical protein